MIMQDEMPQTQFKINLPRYLNTLPGRYIGDVKVNLHCHVEAIDGRNWPPLCSTFLSPEYSWYAFGKSYNHF
jgi:hypothetical protein